MKRETLRFKDEFVVIADNIRSAHNVGSFFRTSDAAGVDKIYLCGNTPAPYPQRGVDRVVKISLGAEKVVAWERCGYAWRVFRRLREEGFNIIALETDKDAVNYKNFVPRFPLALIIGNEVGGLSKKILSLADVIISLPMHGIKESLNVSVAFGIAVYKINEFRK